MKINKGDKWVTRGSEIVLITDIKENDKLPIKGYFLCDKSKREQEWFLSGQWECDSINYADLVFKYKDD